MDDTRAAITDDAPDDALDEALQRLHAFGPEFEGFLSNHGPMVVEVMSRHARPEAIEPWTDRYVRRLEDAPGRGHVIADDHRDDALGDATRVADWISTAAADLGDAPWPDVLAAWWPRLLPGIAAGATHGVIRVGHAVQGLRAATTPVRVAELAHALGYWAARWQPVPVIAPRGRRTPAEVLSDVPVIPDQTGGIRSRLAQLPDVDGFEPAVADLADPGPDVPGALERVVDAVVAGYPDWAAGNPTMLVHAATAPNAVLATLPSLPRTLWPVSFTTAWSASAAVVSVYRPAGGSPPAPEASSDPFDHAVTAGSEHMIKFADTALASYRRTGNPSARRAIEQAIGLGA